MPVNVQKTLVAIVFVGAGLSVFGMGFLRVAGPANGIAFGVMFALSSALAWAASTVVLTTVLNLFAALFAAASAGFLAPPVPVCAWHHLPLLCP